MDLTQLTFTGTVQVPTGITLSPSSTISGYYVYSSGKTSTSSSTIYWVASSFLASVSPSPATVTATLDLPTPVPEIVGQVTLWRNNTSIPCAVTLHQVQTAGTFSQTATSSTTSTSSSLSGSASTSSATAATTNSNASNSQYSTGEIAGVAVACFIGGLLIAGILAFFFRRRPSRQRQNIPHSDKEMSSLHDHGQAVYVAGGKTWEKHLPQSESDHTIRNLANRTLDQIELYVENYYKDAMAMPLNDGAKANFEDLEDAYLDRPILQLIQQTDRPTVIIKHCVASLIISNITASSGRASRNGSFLPAEFMAVLPVSDTRERIGKIKILTRPTLLISVLASNEAISRWQVLTAYLRPTPEHDVSYQQHRNQAIAEAAQQVCQAFGPWARSNDNARYHSLVNIMTRASEFGVMLFAQPASFEWQWSETSGTRSEIAGSQIAALPGLYKTTDQDCHPLAAPLHLLEPRMATLRSW